jgi:excisionase family DNA binding protein
MRQNIERSLSLRDAADLMGLPVDQIRRWILSSRLREYRIEGTHIMRVSEGELLTLVKEMPHPSRLGRTA